jgi:hypothetical protein
MNACQHTLFPHHFSIFISFKWLLKRKTQNQLKYLLEKHVWVFWLYILFGISKSLEKEKLVINCSFKHCDGLSNVQCLLLCFLMNYTTQQIMDIISFYLVRKINVFWCAESEFVFILILSRQVPEMILNESSKNTENTLRKETTRHLTKTKGCVVSLVLSLVLKTVFGIFLAPLWFVSNL